MKTPISHINRLLPAILVILFLTFAAAAQTGSFPAMNAETPPAVVSLYTLNPGGLQGIPNFSNAKNLFNIGDSRVLRAAGIGNYFAGTGAGRITTGFSNAFIGTRAGYNNIQGNQNSFLGFEAGLGNKDGDNNTFVGWQAGYLNNGDRNSFLGSRAGVNNTTGNYNSFVGFEAGVNNTTGHHNSFIGNQAGFNNFTGSFNTFIGYLADVDKDKLKKGEQLTFATAIGAGARVSTINTVALGRVEDTVRIPGRLQLDTLPNGPGVAICRGISTNQIVSCSTSSLRYKKNVAPFSSGLELVQRLKPIRFEWKDGGMKDVGFGAEDIAAVEPLLVTYNDKGQVEDVKYDRIATVLVNAVKEQQAQIEAQQQQLKQQQAVIEGLKKLSCRQNPEAEVCKQ